MATVNNTGRIDASGDAGSDGGSVAVSGGFISSTGTISTDGRNGGSVAMTADGIYGSGAITAQGLAGNGGSVTLTSTGNVQQAGAALVSVDGTAQGGSIAVAAGPGSIYTSGTYTATGDFGGGIDMLGDSVTLAAATLDASGTHGGGTILVGDARHGAGSVQLATDTFVNPFTTLTADATGSGNGGTVVVWSQDSTQFYGSISARGGPGGGNGGWIEASSGDTLTFGGFADAGAPGGMAGSLLLDPRNITIQAGTPTPGDYIQLIDPNTSTNFSNNLVVLANNNIAVGDPNATIGGQADAGAVYLFNGATGALISELDGSHADDHLGDNYGSITALTGNNNLVVASPYWNGDLGATTWMNGATGALSTGGVGGIVSSSNSLVGSNADDYVGGVVQIFTFEPALGGDTVTTIASEITPLTNGNYVVESPNWNGGTGAATWVNGSTGQLTDGNVGEAVSSANSLVGSNAGDYFGSSTQSYTDYLGIYATYLAENSLIIPLTNGNYVVGSPNWNSNTGAATWVNGTTGQTSNSANTISSANSLVGSSTGDDVGDSVTVLTNGNYVVDSSEWSSDKGAATWGDGTAGTSGTVSAANSLVGSSSGDAVGDATPLTNGNYVVGSPDWNSTTGAATWVNGSTGQTSNSTNTISSANSLVGSSSGDAVGSIVTVLTNGNYVVSSSEWSGGKGAVTFGCGSASNACGQNGISGTVSATNSLVGSTGGSNGDGVGFAITVLTNDNYVVNSTAWDGGDNNGLGAVTWVNGSNGELSDGKLGEAISSANSLVGSSSGDRVGSLDYDGVIALTNGNYVVDSLYWSGGKGAVTWVDGSDGQTSNGINTISAANSLIGSNATDHVGANNFSALVRALSNGNYVVDSDDWSGGSSNGLGAVTFGCGSASNVCGQNGVIGTVSAANSLVGSNAGDLLGSTGILVLSNGNYVVDSDDWSGGKGAVTWVNGTTGQTSNSTNTISSANSLVGSTTGDQIGSGYIQLLSDGDYVVDSSYWDGGTTNGLGAVTWVDGSNGELADGNVGEAVSSANSFVGTHTGDRIGTGTIIATSDGGFVVGSPNYNGGVGRVDLFLANTAATPPQLYGDTPGTDVTITTGSITAITDTGTAVTLQANNDLTLEAASNITTSAGGSGGALTLDAGRSIILDSSITTDNGALTLLANDTAADGVADADRLAGAAVISMGSGTTLNTGTGALSITLGTGAGNTNTASGDITLYGLTGGDITAANDGPGNGNLLLDGAISGSGNMSFAAGGSIASDSAGSITETAGTAKSLTLTAGSNIIDNATLSATGSGKLNVLFDSDTAGAGGAIDVAANITSNGGNVTMGGQESNPASIVAGTGFAVGDASYENGILVGGSATVNSGTGNIVMNGQGQAAVNFNSGVENSGTITTASGAITITGQGANAIIDFGVENAALGTISSTGTSGTVGDVTIDGNCSGSGNSGYGVYFNGGTISTGKANLNINGNGGGSTNGVGVGSFGSFTYTGAGALNITGNGGGGSESFGILLDGGSEEINSGSGTITFTGTNAATGIYTAGFLNLIGSTLANNFIQNETGNIIFNTDTINIESGDIIQTTGNVTIQPYSQNGTIAVAGAAAGNLAVTTGILGEITAANTTIGRADGTGLMRVAGANLSSDTFGNLELLNGSANIQFDGGGTALKLASNANFSAATTTGDITAPTATGTIQTQGTGTITLTSGNDIDFADALALTTATGAVTLEANRDITTFGAVTTSGGNVIYDANSGNTNSGYIDVEGNITTNGGYFTAGGGEANPLNIAAGTGYVWGNGLSAAADGVSIGFTNDITVDAGSGNVIINGHGYNNASANDNRGVYIGDVSSGSTLETGSGAITINGTGGNGGSVNYGIDIEGITTTVSGALSLTGIGGTAGTTLSNAGNDGIAIDFNGTASSTGTGTAGAVTLNGTGADAYINNTGIDNAGIISVTDANLSVTGYGGNGTAQGDGISNLLGTIETIGAGNITLTGYGGHYGSGSSSVAEEWGILNEGTIQGTSTGSVTVIGYGGKGVSVNGGLDNFFGTITQSGTGTLDVEGYGGTSGTTSGYSNNDGIANGDGTISSTCTASCGAVTIIGTGAAGSGNNYGINNAIGTISTVAANLTLTGTGGNGTSTGNDGVVVGAGSPQ